VAITGRTLLLVLLGLPAVLLRPQASTAWLWLLLVLVVVAVDTWAASPPRRLMVTRTTTAPVRLGFATTTSLVVANTGRRAWTGVLRDAWQPSAGATDNRHPVSLGPQETSRLTTPLSPNRRGDRRTDRITARSIGPLGLAGRQRSWPVSGAVRVLPPFPSRRHLPSRLARLRELDGRSAVRLRGPGTEFDSLREYVRGDDVRSIDWRASARNRNVVVRTWQPERDRRVVLVLDTSRTSAARVGDTPRLDAAMDSALLLAALAARAGDRVDLVAGDRRVRARVRWGARESTVSRLLQSMADLEPALVEADWSTLVGAAVSVSRQRSLMVLLTSLEPAAMVEGLLPALPTLAARHRVVVASVRDPALDAMAADHVDAARVYDAAAAAYELGRRDQMREVLNGLGVHVVDALPYMLPVALTDHYLALKARGLL
jgi:uncharacterized protein (DUF58 family)